MTWKKRNSFLFLLSTVNYRIVKKRGFFIFNFFLITREKTGNVRIWQVLQGLSLAVQKTKQIWCFSLSNNLPGTPSTKLPLSVPFLEVWRALYPTTYKSHTHTQTQTLLNIKNWEHRCFCGSENVVAIHRWRPMATNWRTRWPCELGGGHQQQHPKMGEFLSTCVCSTYFSGEMLHSESSQNPISLQTWTWRILGYLSTSLSSAFPPKKLLKNEKKRKKTFYKSKV